MKSKSQQIFDYIENGGGGVQFHTIDELCLSTTNGVLEQVILCKATKENPFGIKHIPFSPGNKLTDKILEVINRDK